MEAWWQHFQPAEQTSESLFYSRNWAAASSESFEAGLSEADWGWSRNWKWNNARVTLWHNYRLDKDLSVISSTIFCHHRSPTYMTDGGMVEWGLLCSPADWQHIDTIIGNTGPGWSEGLSRRILSKDSSPSIMVARYQLHIIGNPLYVLSPDLTVTINKGFHWKWSILFLCIYFSLSGDWIPGLQSLQLGQLVQRQNNTIY